MAATKERRRRPKTAKVDDGASPSVSDVTVLPDRRPIIKGGVWVNLVRSLKPGDQKVIKGEGHAAKIHTNVRAAYYRLKHNEQVSFDLDLYQTKDGDVAIKVS